MKIGILGGTFDPIHLAHLQMGRVAMKKAELDEVWYMPSKLPPHKKDRHISDEKLRFHLVELATEDEEGFFASDFELLFPHTTYTAETLERLKRERQEDTFYFIMGGDSLLYFEHWYHPERILRCAELLVVNRNGAPCAELEACAGRLMRQFGGKIGILSMPEMKISSSMIRKRFREGKSVREYLPKKVYDFLSGVWPGGRKGDISENY